MYRTDELLLIEHLTYMSDKAPIISILDAEGMKVGEYLDKINIDALDDEYVYSTQMNGADFRNVILAMKKNPSIANAEIACSHLDNAYGAGGGISIVLISDESVTDEEGRREWCK